MHLISSSGSSEFIPCLFLLYKFVNVMSLPVISAVEGFFADNPELTELMLVPRGLTRLGAGIL